MILAVPLPIPWLAPVTRHVRPSSCKSMGSSKKLFKSAPRRHGGCPEMKGVSQLLMMGA